jgi:hypothetical protein
MPGLIWAQSSPDSILTAGTKKAKIIPGREYEAGGLHEFFFGEHWRSLWATEIEVDVLDLNTFGGGLTPSDKGGGLQTKSLRFTGKDGNEYKFRSLNKDPRRSLPQELQQSVYGDIIQDQISIGVPVSNIIVPYMLKEVGVLHAEPQLIVLPDDPLLGEFRKDFGGLPGTIEINPRAGKKGFNNFEGADKVESGFDIFGRIEKDNDERVIEAEFLKARLVDIFLGDRDRHADQWKWAGYKDTVSGKRYWKPIPRDRDYAFGRYDGLFPWASGLFAHSLVGFSEDYPAMIELTWSGRHLDRRFLSSLSKKQWDSVTAFVKNKLTDDVIRNAVKRMPPRMYAKKGEYLINMLIKRRNNLHEAAEDFYNVYSRVIDIYGSNKREYAEVKRINDKEVQVSLYKADKDTGNKKGGPFYSRIFNSDDTKEIRINLLDGDDIAVVEGNTDESILVRIIGGGGWDKLSDNSKVNGSILGIIPSAQRLTQFYDSDKKSAIKDGAGTYINDNEYLVPADVHNRYEPPVEDRYGFWAFTPVLQSNTEDGLIIGGGPNYTQYGFRADPYEYYVQLTGAYATLAKDYDVRFYGEFYKVVNNAKLTVNMKASELDFNRFYGMGNETTRDSELAGNDFYQTNQQHIMFQPALYFGLTKNLSFFTSPVYEYSDVKRKANTLLDSIVPYGTGKWSAAALQLGLSFDSRDNNFAPSAGIYSGVSFTYYPEILDNSFDFSSLTGDIRGYFTAKTFTDITLALRAGGEKMFGTFPFFKSAAVGGKSNLRGFSRERFAGESSLFGQAELRVLLGTVNLFFPAKLGFSAFTDAGRVFNEGEASEKWHSTYGGGLWLNLLNAFALNVTVARSPEVTKYYFGTGFMF